MSSSIAPPQQVAHRAILQVGSTEEDTLMSDKLSASKNRSEADGSSSNSAVITMKCDGEKEDQFTCDWETHCSQVFGAMWIDEKAEEKKEQGAPQRNNLHSYFKRR
jgi:hypothetical protein